MLVTPCPRCGKPTPARLATPNRLQCSACGYDGPPPEAARTTIEAARVHLEQRDVRSRQISAAVRRASLGWRTALLVVVFIVSSLPTLALLGDVLVHLAHPDEKQLDLSVTWSAFFAFLVGWTIGAMLFEKHRRQQKVIRAAIAAVPPLRLGDASWCRICGADLPAGDAIVRCRFCGADNYADLRAMGRLEKREASDVAAYERDLAIQTSTTAQDMASRGKALLIAAFLMPIGVLVFVDLGLAPLAKHLEGQLDTSTVYASAMTRDGECVGTPLLQDGAYTLDLGSSRFESPSSLGPRLPPTFLADALVGKPVRVNPDHDGSNLEGVVVKAYGSPLGNLVLVRAGGREVRIDVRGVCLVEPAAGYPGLPTGTTSAAIVAIKGRAGSSSIVDDEGTTFSAHRATITRTDRSGTRTIFALHEVLEGDHPNEAIDALAVDGNALSFTYESTTVLTSANRRAFAVRLPKSGGAAHVVTDTPEALR